MPYSNEKVLAPYFDVYVSGMQVDFDSKMHITSIQVEETEDGSDTATIEISDTDYKFIEDNIFIEDAPISLEGGFAHETYRFTFDGYIATIDITFPAEGYPTMSIYCMDGTHLMNRKKKKRTWEDVKSVDVVKEVCGEYGYSVAYDSGYEFIKEDSIAQSNQTDIQFVQSLADKEVGVFSVKLRGNTLYYMQKALLSSPVAELWYKQNSKDIISFKPQINKETKEEEIEVANITSKDKEEDIGKASDGATSREVQGESVKTTSSPTSSGTERRYGFNVEDGKSASAYGENWKEVTAEK